MIPPSLDLNLLRALEALLSTGSVTRAARQLGLGQPAVSKQLERLRQVTGDPLLVPDGRGLTLTERARALLPLVGDAVRAVETVLTPAATFDPKRASASFSLGMNDETSAPLLGRFMQSLRTLAPGLDLRVQPLRRDSTQALDSGRLDLVMMPDVRGVPGFEALDLDRFVLKPALTDEFVVVSRRRRRFGKAEYLQADHVVTTPLGENERSALDVALSREGLKRRVVLTVPTFTLAVLVVMQSELVATVPRRVAERVAPRLPMARPPVRFACPQQLLVWHPRHTTNPAHRFVRELLLASTRNRPPPET